MFMSETIELSITPWLPETAHVICQFWDLIMQTAMSLYDVINWLWNAETANKANW